MADEYADKLDKIVNEYNNIGMFSGNVMVAKDGNIFYEKQFGYADWEKKIPVTPETLFRIGSLNKMFTNAMIKQLEKENKLSLEDPLSKFLELYPKETGDKITIKMLLEMKAGLADYGRNPAFNSDKTKFRTVNDFLEIIKDEPLLFEPGTGQEYSNSGYVVLGGVIEKVTGKSYKENLEERILKPLGMSSTHYLLLGETVPGMSQGTTISFNGDKKSSNEIEMVSPAGGMYSNASDLLKLDRYLRQSGLIPPGIRAGGTPVWNSILAQLKDGYTVIINSNFGNAADGIIQRFMDALENKPYPPADYPLSMKLYKVLDESGLKGLKENLRPLIDSEGMEYRAFHLNMFGYELMNAGELDKAIEVFTLNTELFPENPNVWDSLGEAYMNKGNNGLAIANYRKCIELDPNNQNAKIMLKKLEAK
ncbi:MAG: serine hydrolase [Ignavibacteria bacterium]|nr:serine hydrolase [Ignavibacteria bacterium]